MKKLCYREEDLTFIFRYLLYYLIGAFIVIVVAVPTALLKKTIADLIVETVCVIMILGFMGLIFFSIFYLVEKNKIKKFKLIKQNGMKVPGKIIGWNYDVGGADFDISYNLYVSYMDLKRR